MTKEESPLVSQNDRHRLADLFDRAGRAVAFVRERLSNRDDTEHEQAFIRLGFGLVIIGYLAAIIDKVPGPGIYIAVALTAGCLVIATAHIVHIVMRPQVVPVRRYFGMVVDLGCITSVMACGGAWTAPLYPLILWTTFGHGFRFGRRHLFASSAMSLVLFGLVVSLSSYWQDRPWLAVSLWIALAMLPAYVSILLKKLEDAVSRAEEASRAKSRFLAIMSHELRTPLNAIIGMADLLRGTRLSDEQRDMARTVQSSAHGLLGLIDDILDIAKIETGHRQQIVEDTFNLHRVLMNVRRLLYHQASAKGLRLQLSIDPITPHRLRGGSRPLQQILVNLVANAIKFTDKGSVRLTVDSAPVRDGQVNLRFEVTDTGIGIGDQAQKRIFDTFAQADESTTRRYGGSGLGLAIAKQLVDLMDGQIGVVSSPDAGSTFWVTLPVLLDETDAADSDPLPAGRCIVLGQPGAARDELAVLDEAGLPAERVDDIDEALEALATGERNRTLIVVASQADCDSRTITDRIATTFQSEPIDVILVAQTRSGHDDCLAVIRPEDVRAALPGAVRAALINIDDDFDDGPADKSGRVQTRALDVLVAEDNRTNQRVIAKILERGGHRVRLVDNGEEALDALEAQWFDFVLMDVNMPVMSGLDAIRMYRFEHADDPQPPFVALTADATASMHKTCLDAGFSAFATKPIEANKLLALIDDITAGDGESDVDTALSDDTGFGANVLIHPRAAGGRPVLDTSKLESLRQLDNDPAFLSELIDEFIADADSLIDDMDAAYTNLQVAEFRDLAHALRSSAAHLGATAVFELCLAWRGLGVDELKHDGGRHMARLRQEFDRLRAALLAEKGDTAQTGRRA